MAEKGERTHLLRKIPDELLFIIILIIIIIVGINSNFYPVSYSPIFLIIVLILCFINFFIVFDRIFEYYKQRYPKQLNLVLFYSSFILLGIAWFLLVKVLGILIGIISLLIPILIIAIAYYYDKKHEYRSKLKSSDLKTQINKSKISFNKPINLEEKLKFIKYKKK